MVRIGSKHKNMLTELADSTNTSMTSLVRHMIDIEYRKTLLYPMYKKMDKECKGKYKVYKLTFETGKVYIGATKDFYTRCMAHHSSSRFGDDVITDADILYDSDDKLYISDKELEEVLRNRGNCYNLELHSYYVPTPKLNEVIKLPLLFDNIK